VQSGRCRLRNARSIFSQPAPQGQPFFLPQTGYRGPTRPNRAGLYLLSNLYRPAPQRPYHFIFKLAAMISAL
jgi:hypothetical protein